MSKRIDEVSGYITLQRAAELAGYRVVGNLRTAAARGQLQTILLGNQRLTTQEWLDAYLATLRPGNYKRGLPKGQDADGEAGE